jgi:hypothetical protein
LKNKLKLDAQKFHKDENEMHERKNRYKQLKINRPPHIFIPLEKRGWHDAYEKRKKINKNENRSYEEFKKDRLLFHRKAPAFFLNNSQIGKFERHFDSENSDYDLNYSDVDLDEDPFANINVNDVLDKDIFFEPEVSEPYTRRSEKQYDEDIDYNENENDNRLLHSPSPNDLIEIEDSLHDIVRISSSELIKNQRNFYANNINNLNNGLLKPPNFNDQINKSIEVNKNINDYINSTVKNIFIKPGINTKYNRLFHP